MKTRKPKGLEPLGVPRRLLPLVCRILKDQILRIKL